MLYLDLRNLNWVCEKHKDEYCRAFDCSLVGHCPTVVVELKNLLKEIGYPLDRFDVSSSLIEHESAIKLLKLCASKRSTDFDLVIAPYMAEALLEVQRCALCELEL